MLSCSRPDGSNKQQQQQQQQQNGMTQHVVHSSCVTVVAPACNFEYAGSRLHAAVDMLMLLMPLLMLRIMCVAAPAAAPAAGYSQAAVHACRSLLMPAD
jgi:hypothetical protein